MLTIHLVYNVRVEPEKTLWVKQYFECWIGSKQNLSAFVHHSTDRNSDLLSRLTSLWWRHRKCVWSWRGRSWLVDWWCQIIWLNERIWSRWWWCRLVDRWSELIAIKWSWILWRLVAVEWDWWIYWWRWRNVEFIAIKCERGCLRCVVEIVNVFIVFAFIIIDIFLDLFVSCIRCCRNAMSCEKKKWKKKQKKGKKKLELFTFLVEETYFVYLHVPNSSFASTAIAAYPVVIKLVVVEIALSRIEKRKQKCT